MLIQFLRVKKKERKIKCRSYYLSHELSTCPFRPHNFYHFHTNVSQFHLSTYTHTKANTHNFHGHIIAIIYFLQFASFYWI